MGSVSECAFQLVLAHSEQYYFCRLDCLAECHVSAEDSLWAQKRRGVKDRNTRDDVSKFFMLAVICHRFQVVFPPFFVTKALYFSGGNADVECIPVHQCKCKCYGTVKSKKCMVVGL